MSDVTRVLALDDQRVVRRAMEVVGFSMQDPDLMGEPMLEAGAVTYVDNADLPNQCRTRPSAD